MKHLKKYNESNEEFNLVYIEDCFVEFKDNSEYEYEIEEDELGSYIIEIGINILPVPPAIEDELSIAELVEYGNSINNFYLDIENGIDKVKIKYPNIKAVFEEGLHSNIPDQIKKPLGARYIWIRFTY
jgi:hypothetical protein